MAEKIYFLDATEGVPEYDSAQQAENDAVKFEGIAYGYLNNLEVTAGTGLQVQVDSGAMVSRGRTYIQDEAVDGASPLQLAIDAATSGYLRKDRVVVEYDLPNNQAVAKIVKGQEAVSEPAAPSIADTASKWQVSLGIINIEGNALVSGSEVKDERVFGSQRVSPKFEEDLSAPNIGISDGGKVYLNTAKSAYMRVAGNALYLKLPSCDEVQIPTVVVGTSATPPIPTENYPINTMYLERES